jgi:hypothetical protein
MDIIDTITAVGEKLSNIQEHFAKDAIKKKHTIRRRFYTLLLDYLESPGASSPNDFFAWYLDRLDERMKMAPQWQSAYFNLTKTKNEASFRKFLNSCLESTSEKTDFIDIIKPWLPDDEYRIIASTTSSDIEKVVRIAIEMCEEKNSIQQQIKTAVFSNIPIMGIGFFFHWVLYSFVYTSFITPGIEDRLSWEEMNLLQQNYMRYEWFIANYHYVIMALVAIGMAISWSIKNWHKRAVFFREQYIDYIPPYSLSKVNEQYNILMIIASFMRSGKSFAESLNQVREGASKYVQYQVDKIIMNDTVQAHISLNTFYLGMLGSDIRERAQHISLEKAISGLLPEMKKEKNQRFDRIVKITMMLTFKPVIYLSLAASIVPVFINIYESLPKQ